jgi:cytochrome c oxidase cbb3-type subunit 3
MHFIHLIKKKLLLIVTALLILTPAMAQDTTKATAQTVQLGNNQLVILMVVVAFVLAFVIWGLGRALIALSSKAVEKSKSNTKVTTAIAIMGLILLSQTSFGQNTDATIKEVPNYGGLSATSFYLFVCVIAAEVLVILFLAFCVNSLYKSLLPEKKSAPVKEFKLMKWWASLDKKIFTKAIPVERESDVMLDHDYDGIRELDNPLPPWWKYGFYLTILVAIIYLLNFEVFGTGKNPTEEYTAEMQNAQIQKDLYEANNKDKIDENNVPVADASGLAAAKDIFTTKCFACHGKLGEGGAGPNLTDNYWLHKGSLNDIYHSIKNGYPDKGMQSWASVYTPKEISYLASYIKSLHGTNPLNAKAPQGDLYTGEPGAAAADSSVKQ